MPAPTRSSRPTKRNLARPTEDPWAWFNGRCVRYSRVLLPLDDRMVSRGYGAFESLRSYSKRPYRLQEHLERLEQSCALLRIVLPYTRCELISAVQYIMRRNDFRESLVKIYVTGGRSHSLLPEAPPSVIVACFPLPVFPTRFYRKGISLQTTPLARTLPAAKSTDYLAAVVASVTAHTMGYDEILFTDPATGCLLEGSTFNVFAVVGTTLITPIHGVLAGVTAQDIIALAEEEVGLRVERRGISPKDLDQATELFISSSNREIIPVRQLDDRTFSNCPGRMTRKLASEYLLRAMRQSHWIKP